MNNLNPLYYLQEGALKTAFKTDRLIANHNLLSRAGVVAAHFGNNLLKTKKILDAFPTPDTLKNYLMRSNDPRVQQIGQIMDPNMDYTEYKNFIRRNFNDKFNLLHLISGRVGLGIQGYRGIKNATRTGDQIVNDTIGTKVFAPKY